MSDSTDKPATKKVRYVGPNAVIALPDGRKVDRDSTVEVDAALADELLARPSFKSPRTRTTKKD